MASSADKKTVRTQGDVPLRPDLARLHPNLVLLTDDLRFHVLGDGARSQLAARPGYYSLLVSLSGMLVFAQDRGMQSTGPRARVLMAGEVISASTIVDVVGMIASHRWRGEFQIVTGTTHFQLMIDQGTLQFAASNRPEDELSLWLADVVSEQHVRQVSEELLPGQRLEDALLQRGLLTHEELYARAERLARKVFFDTLTLAEGKYAFVVLPENLDASPPMTLNLRIQEMLLLGVERIDEYELFRQSIPHGNVRPFVRQAPASPLADAHQRLVYLHTDGRRTLDEIARLTGLVEFECLKATHELLEAGVLELCIEELIDDYAIHALLLDFDAVLHDIVQHIDQVDAQEVLRDSLSQWLQSSGYVHYLGEEVAESLHLDAAAIAERLAGAEVEDPVHTLKHALFDLVTFSLIVATSRLPHDSSQRLSEHVQQAIDTISDRWQ